MADVLRKLAYEGDAFAVAVNRNCVPRALHATTPVKERDAIEIHLGSHPMIEGASSLRHAPRSAAPHEEPEQEEEWDQQPEPRVTVMVSASHGTDRDDGDHDREEPDHRQTLEAKAPLAHWLWG